MSEHDQVPPPVNPTPVQPYAAAPAPAQPYAAQPAAQPPAKKRSGCLTCLLGCLGVFLLFLCIIAVAVGWFFNVPVRWGLVASPAEQLFEPGVNPYASNALAEELAGQGLNMEGVSVYVVPAEDPAAHTAYILVDDMQGASWQHDTYKSAAEGFMILAAATQAADTYGIERIAVDHRNAEGVQAAVVTAPTPALREYAAGSITQQELFDQMDAYADMTGMAGGMNE